MSSTLPTADARKEFVFVVPVFQSVYAKPFANFLAMMLSAASREQANYRITPTVPERELLHSAMNRVALTTIQQGAAGLIVCDDDCLPPFHAISSLLRHYEAGHQIVCGMGYMRNYPFTTTIGRYFPEGITIARDPVSNDVRLAGFEWIDNVDHEPDLLRADFCGFPIALITTDALKRMEMPWFGTSIDGADCTHDVFFGARAKAAGIPIMVDKTIDCDHLMDAQLICGTNRSFARSVVAAQKGTLS